MFGLVMKSELKPSFRVVPLAALTLPTNFIRYRVLTASARVGVKVALLPAQVTERAAVSSCPTGLSRKVCLFIDPHFIGKLKFTVTLVSTSTLTAPSAGSVDTTTGRGRFDAAAAGDPAAHTINISATIANRLTTDFDFIVPTEC